ncbi:hypothetical protein OQA88_9204 [Cercophora sp. LCS_1]
MTQLIKYQNPSSKDTEPIIHPTRAPSLYSNPHIRSYLSHIAASIPETINYHLPNTPNHVHPPPAAYHDALYGPGTLYDAILHEGLPAPLSLAITRSKVLRQFRKPTLTPPVPPGHDGSERLNYAIACAKYKRRNPFVRNRGDEDCLRCIVTGGICSYSRCLDERVRNRPRCSACDRKGVACVRVAKTPAALIRWRVPKGEEVKTGMGNRYLAENAYQNGSWGQPKTWWAWSREGLDRDGIVEAVEGIFDGVKSKNGAFGEGMVNAWVGSVKLPDWRAVYPGEEGWKGQLKRQGREGLVDVLIKGKEKGFKHHIPRW